MMLFVFSTMWRAYLLWVIFSLYEKINNKDFSDVSSAGLGFFSSFLQISFMFLLSHLPL
jgi:hypothetical protein